MFDESENDEMYAKKETPSSFEFSEENGDLTSFDRSCLFYHNYFRQFIFLFLDTAYRPNGTSGKTQP